LTSGVGDKLDYLSIKCQVVGSGGVGTSLIRKVAAVDPASDECIPRNPSPQLSDEMGAAWSASIELTKLTTPCSLIR
jgi:hypothetical protein